jgi:predicted GNAT family N-acyltransferase
VRAADELLVRLATLPADVAEALRIRHSVFVDEQGVPVDLEQDERDAAADHFLARHAGVAVGAGRMVVEPAGFEDLDPALGEVAHLGRLAVLPEARGTGLGARLVRVIEARAAERSLRVVYLGAQTHALGFYRRLGYTEFGAEFDDAGLPHRHMSRRL